MAGGPVEHRGLRLVDAAVFEPVPFRAAIADGCTHVFALCTRPPYMCVFLDQGLACVSCLLRRQGVGVASLVLCRFCQGYNIEQRMCALGIFWCYWPVLPLKHRQGRVERLLVV